MTSKVFGNKATKKAHSSERGDACRASEIKPDNRRNFENIRAAEAAGYRRCKLCYRKGETDIL
jgi:hypothetical protein